MLITVFSISCKNNATMSEFTYTPETLDIDDNLTYTQFANKTFLSDAGIDASGTFYLWVRTTETGIKYTQGPKNAEPNFDSGFTEIPLSQGASSKKPSEKGYTFSGTPPSGGTTTQSGTLEFATSGKLTITFSQGAGGYTGATYVCQYVVY